MYTYDQKDEIVVNYMKKMWAGRNEEIENIDPTIRWNKVEKAIVDKALNKRLYFLTSLRLAH